MNCKKIFTLVIFFSFAVAAFAQTDTFHLDETYPVDPAGIILLQSNDADVTITGSNRDDVHVTISYKLEVDGFSLGDYEKFDVKVWTDNGKLYIEEQPREMDQVVIGDTDESYTITIEAPKNISLKLRGDDEDYELNNIDGEIRIDAEDASISCVNCDGGFFAFRLDDGDIRMNNGQGILNADIEDGSINIGNSAFKIIKISGDDADLEIQNQAQTGGRYQFTLGDADLELDLAGGNRSGAIQVGIKGDDVDVSIQTSLKNDDEYHINGGDAYVEFNTVSGGGTFYIRHDDASISSAPGYQILLNEEGRSKYRLNEGGATIKINVDDADIDLQ